MPAPRPGPPLVAEKEIAARVAELGRAIARDYADARLVLVGVLQGAIPFVADLMRAVALDVTVDFLQTDVTVDYVGFTIPNVFVVGYGLDYGGLYRNLPYVATLDGI